MPLFDGRDSIRVRLIPRRAKTPSRSCRSPARSVSGSMTMLHFSAPFPWAGFREIRINRVVLDTLFSISGTITGILYRLAAVTESIAPAFGVFFASSELDALLLVWITGRPH